MLKTFDSLLENVGNDEFYKFVQIRLEMEMNLLEDKCKALINNLMFRKPSAKLLPSSKVKQNKIACLTSCSGTKRNNT